MVRTQACSAVTAAPVRTTLPAQAHSGCSLSCREGAEVAGRAAGSQVSGWTPGRRKPAEQTACCAQPWVCSSSAVLGPEAPCLTSPRRTLAHSRRRHRTGGRRGVHHGTGRWGPAQSTASLPHLPVSQHRPSHKGLGEEQVEVNLFTTSDGNLVRRPPFLPAAPIATSGFSQHPTRGHRLRRAPHMARNCPEPRGCEIQL